MFSKFHNTYKVQGRWYVRSFENIWWSVPLNLHSINGKLCLKGIQRKSPCLQYYYTEIHVQHAYLSIYLSIFIYLSIYVSSIHLFIYPSICLSFNIIQKYTWIKIWIFPLKCSRTLKFSCVCRKCEIWKYS